MDSKSFFLSLPIYTHLKTFITGAFALLDSYAAYVCSCLMELWDKQAVPKHWYTTTNILCITIQKQRLHLDCGGSVKPPI